MHSSGVYYNLACYTAVALVVRTLAVVGREGGRGAADFGRCCFGSATADAGGRASPRADCARGFRSAVLDTFAGAEEPSLVDVSVGGTGFSAVEPSEAVTTVAVVLSFFSSVLGSC